MRSLHFVDSHTGGEPTRVILEGGPDLKSGPLSDRRERFTRDFDSYRSAVVNEPRGSDVLVGALLVPPHDPASTAGVIFFNNVGTLGMCGHGLIGLITTLAHLERIRPGDHRIDTPVGPVTATLHRDGSVSIINVPSWRSARNVAIDVPNLGSVVGDVAWGGNWFFLVQTPAWPLDLARVDELVDVTWRIRKAANQQGYPQIDHVELFGPAREGADSRNFVLCPGKAYDRSPCGTGTSAKLACLAADGRVAEGQAWVQEGILGSRFTARFTWLDRSSGRVVPTITGTAHITAEGRLILSEADPYCWGVGLGKGADGPVASP
ncbi:MAG: proline racemase family protein [Limisphaerales bacterium]